MDWNDFNLNFGGLNEEMENHPLNVFTKLYAEDKRNKVYKDCLENEIENAIDQLAKSVDSEMICFFKQIMDCCDLNENELMKLSGLSGSNFGENIDVEEMQVKIYVTKKIVNGVYERIKNQEHKND